MNLEAAIIRNMKANEELNQKVDALLAGFERLAALIEAGAGAQKAPQTEPTTQGAALYGLTAADSAGVTVDPKAEPTDASDPDLDDAPDDAPETVTVKRKARGRGG